MFTSQGVKKMYKEKSTYRHDRHGQDARERLGLASPEWHRLQRASRDHCRLSMGISLGRWVSRRSNKRACLERRTFDRLEEITSCFEASIGAVITFRGEAHRCTVGPTRLRCGVVAAGHVNRRLLGTWVSDVTTYVPLQCHASLTITGP